MWAGPVCWCIGQYSLGYTSILYSVLNMFGCAPWQWRCDVQSMRERTGRWRRCLQVCSNAVNEWMNGSIESFEAVTEVTEKQTLSTIANDTRNTHVCRTQPNTYIEIYTNKLRKGNGRMEEHSIEILDIHMEATTCTEEKVERLKRNIKGVRIILFVHSFYHTILYCIILHLFYNSVCDVRALVRLCMCGISPEKFRKP